MFVVFLSQLVSEMSPDGIKIAWFLTINPNKIDQDCYDLPWITDVRAISQCWHIVYYLDAYLTILYYP